MTDTGPLRRPSVRARLAIGMALTALIVAAVVASSATLLASRNADEVSAEPLVGTASVGGDVVIIIADEGGAAAADARAATFRWSVVVLALAVVPAVGIGWAVAGRMLRTVDSALADAEANEEDRARRLQEVVHELRTPLAVIGTNLELAASGMAEDSETTGFLEASFRALDRMDRTVDDLAGGGGLTVDVTHDPVDLATVATDVVGEYAGLARRRGLHLMTRGSGPVLAESAEPVPLRTVVGNLVANAVRLAPRGSLVALDWGDAGDWVWIAVTDEGPGVPTRHHSRVFERGWRGSHERHRAEGAGLGLTIARQLTEAQGGAMTLDSGEGEGSTFAVWLPRTAEADRFDVVATDGIHPVITPWGRAPVAPVIPTP